MNENILYYLYINILIHTDKTTAVNQDDTWIGENTQVLKYINSVRGTGIVDFAHALNHQ